MRLTFFLGLLCINLAVINTARADASFSCTDYRGMPVSTVYTSRLSDGAIAKQTKFGHPIIVANKSVLSKFSPAMTTFVYAHECAHHVLGHLKNKISNKSIEQEADCWAAQQLVEQGVFDYGNLREVQKIIRIFGKQDKSHPHPHNRAKRLTQCLGQKTVAYRGN